MQNETANISEVASGGMRRGPVQLVNTAPLACDSLGIGRSNAMNGNHGFDHLADGKRLAGAAFSVRNQLKQRLGLFARCCSGKSSANPASSARCDQPEP